MDRSTFARHVAALPVGKRLPDGVYAHVELVPHLPAELRSAIEDARRIAGVDENAFHVIKFSARGHRLSLLVYPGFFDEPFPTLAASWAVDLGARTVAHRTYAADNNPPVLHRKEALLPPDHPRRPELVALTAAAEQLGLLADAKAIGTRQAWEARLARLGVQLEGHRFVQTAREVVDAAAPEALIPEPVQRHRTALQRYSLSTPMQALFRHGYLDGRGTVFDYGCGRGDDIRILQGLGVDVAGWDPHFAPKNAKRDADVVNFGFVINVIEDVRERRAALMGAYTLARKVLAVAALIGGRTAYEQHRLFRDGVLTTRGTFQKYFTQQELREYLEETLGREPIAVAPGIFFEETDPRLPVLRQLLKPYDDDPLEDHEDLYTEEELDSARLLIMCPNRQAEVIGGVEYGMTYDLSGACPACGTGGRQTSALFVDFENLFELEDHRAGATIFYHILVDEGLEADLEAIGATGLSFRNAYAAMPDKRQVKIPWKQLCAAKTLPPMSPRTTGLVRERPCEVCWRNGYFQTGDEPTRIVYRAADLRDADDVNMTWENLGYAILEPDLRDSLLSYPWTLVTPRVRRVLLDAGVTEFNWLPIRVEDSDG